MFLDQLEQHEDAKQVSLFLQEKPAVIGSDLFIKEKILSIISSLLHHQGQRLEPQTAAKLCSQSLTQGLEWHSKASVKLYLAWIKNGFQNGPKPTLSVLLRAICTR